jgi:hypothetical protein
MVRQSVLEVAHEDPCARVQCVDHHLALGGAGDLDPAVEQVLRDVAHLPVGRPDAAGGGVEVGPLAGVQRALAVGPGAQQAPALLAELSLQSGDEAERLVTQNLLVTTTLRIHDLDAFGSPHGSPPT